MIRIEELQVVRSTVRCARLLEYTDGNDKAYFSQCPMAASKKVVDGEEEVGQYCSHHADVVKAEKETVDAE